jgi:hypothetical protein
MKGGNHEALRCELSVFIIALRLRAATTAVRGVATFIRGGKAASIGGMRQFLQTSLQRPCISDAHRSPT